MLKKVSVVVPVYNMEDSLEQCVASLQNQTYGDFEIILVNDGSKDGSGKVCDRIAAADPRVHVVHTENRGSGPARNAGIAVASGSYIYFPDADDYLEPHAIATMAAAMETQACDLVVFGFRNVNQNGKVLATKVYEECVADGDQIRMDYADYMVTMNRFGIQGAPWNKFFDLQVIRQYGIEYPPLRRHQDEGFISRYMCHAKKVHYIPDVLYTYYVNDLQKEWQKYPVDYIDAVMGLYQVRKETILKWNQADTVTHDMIAREYICNIIKSMELTFSPKHSLKAGQRLARLKEYAERSALAKIAAPKCLMFYQRVVLSIMRTGCYWLLYMALGFKVKIEAVLR